MYLFNNRFVLLFPSYWSHMFVSHWLSTNHSLMSSWSPAIHYLVSSWSLATHLLICPWSPAIQLLVSVTYNLLFGVFLIIFNILVDITMITYSPIGGVNQLLMSSLIFLKNSLWNSDWLLLLTRIKLIFDIGFFLFSCFQTNITETIMYC